MANLAEVWLNLWFYRGAARLPRGTGVRPMALTAVFFLVAMGALIVALPLSLAGAKQGRGRGRLVGRIGVVLSLTPLPLAFLLFQIAAAQAGVFLED